jgi:hypothetical protein
LVRGQVIIEERELVAEPGAGRFIRRARVLRQLAGRATAADELET